MRRHPRPHTSRIACATPAGEKATRGPGRSPRGRASARTPTASRSVTARILTPRDTITTDVGVRLRVGNTVYDDSLTVPSADAATHLCGGAAAPA